MKNPIGMPLLLGAEKVDVANKEQYFLDRSRKEYVIMHIYRFNDNGLIVSKRSFKLVGSLKILREDTTFLGVKPDKFGLKTVEFI